MVKGFLLGFLCCSGAVLLNTSSCNADEPDICTQTFLTANSAKRGFAVTNFADLKRLAKWQASQKYKPSAPLPESLAALSYDQYRLIHYRHDHGVWWKQKPFWFEAFHRGFVHHDQVKIHVISRHGEFDFRFDPKHFQYRGELENLEVPLETEYAGLRIAGKFPESGENQEMLTFVGASYFRARTEETGYGASNRGLAINVGSNQPEEFPVFREFWVIEPDDNARDITVLALMDSISVTGAYLFRFHPGQKEAAMEVQANLYFREQPNKVALAPLTSMWMWGDGLVGPPLDKRPAVHDSDGLLVQAGNQWIWRALSRQSYPSVSRVEAADLQGFGLLQRDNRYERFQDDSAQYHLRPSLWIEPTSAWPAGYVELFELPGAHEGIDNIGAYWVLSEPVQEELSYSYKIHYFTGDYQHPQRNLLAKVTKTEIKRPEDNAPLEVQVYFSTEGLQELTDPAQIQVQLTTIRAEVLEQKVEAVDPQNWVLTLKLKPEGAGPCELRAQLTGNQGAVSEVWSYLCAVKEPPYQFPAVYTRME